MPKQKPKRKPKSARIKAAASKDATAANEAEMLPEIEWLNADGEPLHHEPTGNSTRLSHSDNAGLACDYATYRSADGYEIELYQEEECGDWNIVVHCGDDACENIECLNMVDNFADAEVVGSNMLAYARRLKSHAIKAADGDGDAQLQYELARCRSEYVWDRSNEDIYRKIEGPVLDCRGGVAGLLSNRGGLQRVDMGKTMFTDKNPAQTWLKRKAGDAMMVNVAVRTTGIELKPNDFVILASDVVGRVVKCVKHDKNLYELRVLTNFPENTGKTLFVVEDTIE